MTLNRELDGRSIEPFYLLEIALQNGGPMLYFADRNITVGSQTYEKYIESVSGISDEIKRIDSTFLNANITIQFKNIRFRTYNYLIEIGDTYPFEGALCTIKQLYTAAGTPLVVFVGYLDQPENIDLAGFTCQVSSVLANVDRTWKQRIIDTTTYPNAWEDVGKPEPAIYGADVLVPALRVDWGARTTLKSAIDASQTTGIELSIYDRFPASGTVIVDSEEISFTGRSSGVLSGVTRGANSTIASAHAAAATAWEKKAQYDSLLAGHQLKSVGDIYAEIQGELLRVTSGVSAVVVGGKHLLRATGSVSVAAVSNTVAVVDTTDVHDTIAVNDGITVSDTIAVNDGSGVSDTILVNDGSGVSDTIAVNDGIGVTDNIAVSTSANELIQKLNANTPLTYNQADSGYKAAYWPTAPSGTLSDITAQYTFLVTCTAAPSSRVEMRIYHGAAGDYTTVAYIETTGAITYVVASPFKRARTSWDSYCELYKNSGSGGTWTFTLQEAVMTCTRPISLTKSGAASKTGSATKSGGAAKTGSVTKSGGAAKTGSVSKSGNAAKSGTASKSGLAAKTGTVALTGGVIATYMVDRFHAKVDGYADPDGNYGGIGNLIERPDYVIKHFIVQQFGRNISENNASSFSAAGTYYASAISGGYKFAFRIDQKITPSQWLQRMAFECRSTIQFRAGQWYLDPIPDAAPTVKKTISAQDITGQYGKMTFSHSPIIEIVNDITASLKKNYSRMGSESDWLLTSIASDAISQAKYDLRPLALQFECIRVQTMADHVVAHILLHRKNTTLMVTFPIFWEYFDLVTGDTFDISNPLYNARKFSIEAFRRIDKASATVIAREWPS
ncbi:MAG: hypothetical protein M0024_01270 [Nitrospiraceae bacterium]|nr:hypothetical protein [Nitrospiraceae bacterium]